LYYNKNIVLNDIFITRDDNTEFTINKSYKKSKGFEFAYGSKKTGYMSNFY